MGFFTQTKGYYEVTFLISDSTLKSKDKKRKVIVKAEDKNDAEAETRSLLKKEGYKHIRVLSVALKDRIEENRPSNEEKATDWEIRRRWGNRFIIIFLIAMLVILIGTFLYYAIDRWVTFGVWIF